MPAISKAAERSRKARQQAREFRHRLKADVDFRCNTCQRKCHESELHFAHWDRNAVYRSYTGQRRFFAQMSIPCMIKELPLGRFTCYECHLVETEAETKVVPLEERSGKSQSNRQSLLKKHAFVRGRKEEIGKCHDCDKTVEAHGVASFQFDHRDPELKVASIAQIIKMRGMKGIQEELEKCDLVCLPCHDARGRMRRGDQRTRGRTTKSEPASTSA